MKELDALRDSVSHLRQIVDGLDESQYTAQAYPSEWSIAQVMSHIGSGATIMGRSVTAAASGTTVPEGFNQSVWDEWNAKAPSAQVTDALAADQAFLAAVDSLSDDQRTSLGFDLGPMHLDVAGLIGLRLNEHALHTWDVEVVGDPSAGVNAAAVPLIVDNLAMIARWAGKPDGEITTIAIHTTDPSRDIAISTDAELVVLTGEPTADAPDLVLPAEALIRLVYGRLDRAHTPAAVEGHVVERLRGIFRGV